MTANIIKFNNSADIAKTDMLEMLTDIMEKVENNEIVALSFIYVDKENMVAFATEGVNDRAHQLVAGTVYLQKKLVDDMLDN